MLRVEQPVFLLDFKEEKGIFWPEDGDSNKWTLAHIRQTAWCPFQEDLLINPNLGHFESLKYRVCLFIVF